MNNSNAIIEINKKNLLYNYKLFDKITKNKIVAATIKANAYGLGDNEVLKILVNVGCKHFFLATTEEGIRIRGFDKKVNIYILNGLENNSLGVFNKHKLIPILNSEKEINILLKNKLLKTKFKFGIHVETGLNRLGLSLKEFDKKIFKKFNLEILISHLASSDELENKYNKLQNLNFIKSFNKFKTVKYKSLCASYGAMNNKGLHHDMVRPGISLYGGVDNIKLKKKYKIKSVIKLKGKILQIKEVEKDQYIGYNQTYKTNKATKIAIIGIGYADGLSRLLSNNGKLFYKNDSYNIIGRISMDTLTIDISKSNYEIKIGEYIEIINDKFTIDNMAKKTKTISNEVLTSISKRVKRVYV